MSACTCIACTTAAAMLAFREEVDPARDSKQVEDEMHRIAQIAKPHLLQFTHQILADAIAALGLYGHDMNPKVIAPIRMLVAVVTVQNMLAEQVVMELKNSNSEEDNTGSPTNVH